MSGEGGRWIRRKDLEEVWQELRSGQCVSFYLSYIFLLLGGVAVNFSVDLIVLLFRIAYIKHLLNSSLANI